MSASLCALIEAGPYQFALDTKAGRQYCPEDPYPAIRITAVRDARVREWRWQTLTGRAGSPPDDRAVRVLRLVAVLEGGEEVEVQRVAAVLTECAQVPMHAEGRCPACGGVVPEGTGVSLEGTQYHLGCIR